MPSPESSIGPDPDTWPDYLTPYPGPYELMCFYCGRGPAETHGSFVQDGDTAENYVRTEEGTYNPENGHYACDTCYVAIGMPTSPRGWVAP